MWMMLWQALSVRPNLSLGLGRGGGGGSRAVGLGNHCPSRHMV